MYQDRELPDASLDDAGDFLPLEFLFEGQRFAVDDYVQPVPEFYQQVSVSARKIPCLFILSEGRLPLSVA